MVGKIRSESSKHWKNRAQKFQALETAGVITFIAVPGQRLDVAGEVVAGQVDVLGGEAVGFVVDESRQGFFVENPNVDIGWLLGYGGWARCTMAGQGRVKRSDISLVHES
jgi:hypothetical protein